MKSLVTLGALAVLVAGCTSWQPPRPPSEHYYCTPDSAIRYRGRIPPGAVTARPAPPSGSCRQTH